MSGPPPPRGWTPPPPAVAPPGPAPGLAYAGFVVRTGAFIVDACALVLLVGAILIPLGVPFGEVKQVEQFGVRTWTFDLDPTTSTVNTLLSAAYFVGFWVVRGQTPGMMLFGLRVVRAEDGTRLDIVTAVIRYLMLLISFALLFLGVIAVAVDRHKQGWHDRLVRTVVVRPT
jgi:uncharacterized RDD family membrane protein YckC